VRSLDSPDRLLTANCQPATVVAISLGSNLGDRHAHLDHAILRLKEILRSVRVSRFIETNPVDVNPQPKFLNAGLIGLFTGAPRELLGSLTVIERERGRERPFPGAARTLDLDLVLFGDCVVDEPGLRVPHPRFRERRFVLQPLAEIAPELVDPVTGRTVGELLRRLREDGKDGREEKDGKHGRDK
jgi:2-amino-4-hydroxy-6-hydroxymethyldihydropteridine diphosphokinase